MINVWTLFVLGSFAFGIFCCWLTYRIRLGAFHQIAQNIHNQAEKEANELLKKVKLEQLEQQHQVELKWRQEQKKMHDETRALVEREQKLAEQLGRVEKKLSEIEKKEQKLQNNLESTATERVKLREQEENLFKEIQRIAQLSVKDAREELIAKIQFDLKEEYAILIQRSKLDYEREKEKIASSILVTTLGRLAVPSISANAVHTVAIPSEEMKRRIVGREGRNIKTLEKLTGVNFSIDTTPGAVVLSGFDPIRLQTAKIALSDLIQDGRIHPTKIEELVLKAQFTVQKQIKQYGEEAAFRSGAANLHPDLCQLLGQLKFRYSGGQNILEHSLEVSYLMGLLAAELHLDIKLAKRIGLLHDIGKAVSHEYDGPHALVGRDIALRCGESAEVANGIGCHHNEIEPITVEGSLCSTADALSAARPGARIEAVEEYMKRLHRLEHLVMSFPGVETVYALEAGREVRVIVKPDSVDDAGAIILAREITQKIKSDLTYPGRIKVTVSREKRVVDYAG